MSPEAARVRFFSPVLFFLQFFFPVEFVYDQELANISNRSGAQATGAAYWRPIEGVQRDAGDLK